MSYALQVAVGPVKLAVGVLVPFGQVAVPALVELVGIDLGLQNYVCADIKLGGVDVATGVGVIEGEELALVETGALLLDSDILVGTGVEVAELLLIGCGDAGGDDERRGSTGEPFKVHLTLIFGLIIEQRGMPQVHDRI